MDVKILYLNATGDVQVEVWECASNAEALFLADDICRKGLLIRVGPEVRMIPPHRVAMVTFTEGGENSEPPERKKNELGLLLSKWRAASVEPCPAGMKCKLFPRLVKDLEKVMEG